MALHVIVARIHHGCVPGVRTNFTEALCAGKPCTPSQLVEAYANGEAILRAAFEAKQRGASLEVVYTQ